MYQHTELLNFTSHSLGVTTVKALCKNAARHKQHYVSVCDFNTLSAWPELFVYSAIYKLTPIFGCVFRVSTPQKCFLPFVDVYCFAENQNGVNQIEKMYRAVCNSELDFSSFQAYRQDIKTAFHLGCRETLMLALPNISETFLQPDFIFIGKSVLFYRCWEHTLLFLQAQNIPIYTTQSENVWILNEDLPADIRCYLAALPAKSDEALLQDFSFLSEELKQKALFKCPVSPGEPHIQSIQIVRDGGS